MRYFLENEKLRIQVDSRGGELLRILSKEDNKDFLWQRDENYWADSAPNLFPFVGRLEGEKYICKGKTWNMEIHGFLPTVEMQCEESRPDRLVMVLEDSKETKKIYPYSFLFRLIYTLKDDVLNIVYQVTNKDNDTMHFGIGGHPGFCVPIRGSSAFEDYYLEFPDAEDVERVLFSEKCLVTGKQEKYPLANGKKIPLRHSLFDDDAVVLEKTGSCVYIKCPDNAAYVKVTYPQMPYIGIWHRVKAKAPYVCIEPWVTLPGMDGETTILEEKKDAISLPVGEVYENTWTITCSLG